MCLRDSRHRDMDLCLRDDGQQGTGTMDHQDPGHQDTGTPGHGLRVLGSAGPDLRARVCRTGSEDPGLQDRTMCLRDTRTRFT